MDIYALVKDDFRVLWYRDHYNKEQEIVMLYYYISKHEVASSSNYDIDRYYSLFYIAEFYFLNKFYNFILFLKEKIEYYADKKYCKKYGYE